LRLPWQEGKLYMQFPVKYSRPFSVIGIAAGLLGALAARACAEVAPLHPGDMAPAFSEPDQTGKIRQLKDYKGHRLVLAFYPKDFTYG
jgi:hypothetical protein